MTQLIKTITKVRKQVNPKLQVDGILLTLVDGRTNLGKGDCGHAAAKLWDCSQNL